jgi:hypothetical protein
MDLVIRHPRSAAPMSRRSRHSPGAGIHALASGAPGLPALRASSAQDVAALCAAAGIDHAFVPAGQTRDRVRVVAMDMDST